MPTIPNDLINVKLLKEARRFNREEIRKPRFRARCEDCIWEWQSSDDDTDPKGAEDRANAHMANERHKVEVVFDLLANHHKSFHPAAEGVS